MKDFKGKVAVITGGGTGMGRELARQLSAEGCHVAMCDVSKENMEETRTLCMEQAPEGTQVTPFLADVSHEDEMIAFRDAVEKQHGPIVHLLFNNAGIGGGGSFLTDGREEWEKTFDVCWKGVYYGCRSFVPMIVASDGGHIINTSSVNGFWASLGPQTPHTAYSAAKFAVKGFTEALQADLRINAPHVKASLVMPGHIGTSIIINSGKLLGVDPENMTDEQLTRVRERIDRMGGDGAAIEDDQLRMFVEAQARAFRDNAPTTAAEAATVILDGVREERWRILIGDDARALDEQVRGDPENAYEEEFFQEFLKKSGWGFGAS